MKVKYGVLVFFVCVAPLLCGSELGDLHTKLCPYAELGLTWKIVAESNIMYVQLIRSNEDDSIWQAACDDLQQYKFELPEAIFEHDASNALLMIQRNALSDEEWVGLLQAVVDHCDSYIPIVKRTVYLNRFVEE